MFRPVTITAVLNGWIVTCGCQTVVYQERNQLVSELDAYLKDPDATAARFLKSSVNQAHTGGEPVAIQHAGVGDTVRVALPRAYDREIHARDTEASTASAPSNAAPPRW